MSFEPAARRGGPLAPFAVFVAGLILLRAAGGAVNPGGVTAWEDETAYLFEARVLASGRVAAAAPPEPAAFATATIVIDEGRWYGKYFPGHSLLLAPLLAAGLERWLNPALGAVAAAAVFVLARSLAGGLAGLFAACAVLLAPGVLAESAFLLSHPAAHAALAIMAATRRRSVAGAAFVAALMTRPLTALAMGGPWLLLDGLLALRRGAHAAALLALVPLLLGGIGLMAWNTALTGDPLTTGYQKVDPTDHPGFDRAGFGPARALADTGRRLGRFLFLETVPMLTVVAVAAGVAEWRAGRSRSTLLALATGPVLLVAVHATYHFGELDLVARYYHEAVAPVSVLAGIGLARFAGGSRRTAVATVAALALASAVPAALLGRSARAGLEPGRRLVEAVRTAAAEAEAPSLLFVAPGPKAYAVYEILFPLNAPDLQGGLVVARGRNPEADLALAHRLGRSRVAWLEPGEPGARPDFVELQP